jgi:hypothetical protein
LAEQQQHPRYSAAQLEALNEPFDPHMHKLSQYITMAKVSKTIHSPENSQTATLAHSHRQGDDFDYQAHLDKHAPKLPTQKADPEEVAESVVSLDDIAFDVGKSPTLAWVDLTPITDEATATPAAEQPTAWAQQIVTVPLKGRHR